MILKFNGKIFKEFNFYCDIHKMWSEAGDEMNCCAIELEESLQEDSL